VYVFILFILIYSSRSKRYKDKDRCKIVVLNELSKENIHDVAENALNTSYDNNKGGLDGKCFDNLYYYNSQYLQWKSLTAIRTLKTLC
jgi:cation transport regulator ChaB